MSNDRERVGSTSENAPARRLAAALDEWIPRLEAIPPERSSSLHAGSWNARQLVGHLVDSAQVNLERFLRARPASHLDFPGYPQDEWVELNRYVDAEWSALVGLWRGLNERILGVVRTTPDEVLRLPRAHHALDRIAFRTVPPDQPVTLEDFMLDYVDHLEHHLRALLPG